MEKSTDTVIVNRPERRPKKSRNKIKDAGKSKKKDKKDKKVKVKKSSAPAKKLENYSLGEQIGKGGFASVFKGIHTLTGKFVAIKRVDTHGMEADQLREIQMEIDLLKFLDHENIVKYMESIQTEDYLHIVLEYMENGSLSDIMKKFDIFSESLCAIYIYQVLRGLDYLHKQGVIHRDIKGANILTTKDGLVKLADFGVAMKSSDSTGTEADVVGTPYWMAPEIIEMTAPTPSCDIWSVGCTVVELLDGKAPYFDLDPMAALFRIVQDQHPPLPPHISEPCKDFLLQCFKKEPSFRQSAEQLMKHPWLSNSVKNTNSTDVLQGGKIPESVRNTIKLYKGSSTHSMNAKPSEPVVASSKLFEPEPDDDDDWDADFDDEGPIEPIQLSLSRPRLTTEETEMGAQLRALQGAGGLVDSLATNDLAGVLDASEIDDFFWDDEGEEEDFNNRITRMNHQRDKSSSSPSQVSQQPSNISNNNIITRKHHTTSSTVTLLQLNSGEGLVSRNAKVVGAGADASSSDVELSRFAETDGDEWTGSDGGIAFDALIGESDGAADADNLAARLRRRLSMNVNLELNHGGTDDGNFDSMDIWEGEFDAKDFEEDIERENTSRQAVEILRLIRLLKPSEDDDDILNACKTLITIFRENPAQRQHLVTHHGVIPIMEMLEVSSKEVLHAVLQVVNQIIKNDTKFQENLSLVGLIPVMMRFAASNETLPIRTEASRFVAQICNTSQMTLQMFIACGGLPILVGFLDPPYDHHRELLTTAVNGIKRTFELNTVQNDFCRMFAKANLLPRLIHILEYYTIGSHATIDRDNAENVAGIFLTFATNGDEIVKEAMAHTTVLTGIIRLLRVKPPKEQSEATRATIKRQAILLKCIQKLSMHSNCLDRLHAAGTIETLVAFLDGHDVLQEIRNTILHAMFYLCQINHERQELAAKSGVIPHLKSIISTKSPLKQFALPIYCDLVHASSLTREILWKSEGLQFYLDNLKENYWSTVIVKCVASFLSHDLDRVESILLKPTNLIKLISVFQSEQNARFEKISEPFKNMVIKSVNLNRALGRSSFFVSEVCDRLKYPKATVRRELLLLLETLLENHDRPKEFISNYNLYQVIKSMTKDKQLVLVHSIASRVLNKMYEILVR